MPLYVVMTNLPGPHARALLREKLRTPRLEQDDTVVLDVAELLSAVDHACEFVELEDERGAGVGPSSGVDWQTKSSFTGPTYAMLGPFVAERDYRKLLDTAGRLAAEIIRLRDHEGAPSSEVIADAVAVALGQAS